MAGKIKFYFDVYENTFTSVSDDFDYDPASGIEVGKAIENFYLERLKEALQLGITDPDTLSLSAMYYDESRIRQVVSDFPEKVLRAIAKFNSIRNLEITFYDLSQLDMRIVFDQMETMQHVNLSNTNINSIEFPSKIYPELETLALENNCIDSLPEGMKQCSKLKTFVLKNNPLIIANPVLQKLVDESLTNEYGQEILREYFEEKSTSLTYTKYHDQLINECINPVKEFLREEHSHNEETPDVTMGVQLSKFPHELNLNSSYYRHIYLSFMLYYRIYFEKEGELQIRVDEKNLFGALSNAKYEFQSKRKERTVSLVEQYEIFFYWMYVAKPFNWSDKLRTATTEVLSLIHIFTVCKILEEINRLPSTPNILQKQTIMKLRDIIHVRPSDPFSINDTMQVEQVRVKIRDMIQDLIPSELKKRYMDEYAETAIKEEVDKNLINIAAGS